MESFKELDIFEISESTTNPAGRDKGPEFDDLVKSIKEKGVLQPVIVRWDGNKYVMVAGHRRLKAAKEAGLKKIPAMVKTLTDNEALEIQIIENLQRTDVHPLEEGEQYRKLIEQAKSNIKDVATKVGKDEKYVRGRLVLTNLEEKLAKMYRDGKIGDASASLIARLAHADQDKVRKEMTQRYGGVMDYAEIKEWIERHIWSPIDHQPWLGSKELEKVVGPCKECQPNVATLFGAVKAGACTSLTCWARKMTSYVNHLATAGAVRITDYYGETPKGVLRNGQWSTVGKGSKCGHEVQAVHVAGSSIGTTVTVCCDPKCEKHGNGGHERGGYVKSPAERLADKKARQAAVREKEKKGEEITEALKKIKWPMTEKQLDQLYELMFEIRGTSVTQSACSDLKLKGEKRTGKDQYGRDYEKPLRAYAEKDGNNGKIRMVFRLMVAGLYKWKDALKKMQS